MTHIVFLLQSILHSRSILASFLVAVFLVWAPASSARTDLASEYIASISKAEIPQEARNTLERIRAGGPFPYRRDGVEFQNRERRLPYQKRGYYREFTVRTPGITNRGAQRIVAGAPEEFYYTKDHYLSFLRVVP